MLKFIVAATLLATPAAAKTWSDASCSVGLTSENGGFTFQPHDGDAVRCEIADWPVDQQKAKLSCDDGSKPVMVVISDSQLTFNGVEMTEVTDTGPICD